MVSTREFWHVEISLGEGNICPLLLQEAPTGAISQIKTVPPIQVLQIHIDS